jgi:hypothetical protein
LFKETYGFSVLNAQRIEVSNKDKNKNLCATDRIRQKANTTLVKRNSYGNWKEELGR